MFSHPASFLCGTICMRKRRWLLIVVVLLGAAIPAFQKVNSFGHRELEAYVAVLRSKGERVTFPELAATLSRHTNDSFARLTNLMLKLGPAPADAQDLWMARFAETGHARPLCSLDFPWTATSNGAPNGSWSELSRRIADAAPLLREANHLLERPAPNLGPWTNCFDRPIGWPEKRQAANWLACAALSDLRNDRRDAALADIRALAGLANVHKEEFVMASQMARAAVGETGCDLIWEALQRSGWNEGQLVAMQRYWETHDFLAALETAMEGERCAPLEAIAICRDRSRPEAPRPRNLRHAIAYQAYRTTVMENDALYGLRHLHTEVGFARQLRQDRPFNEVMESFRKLDDRLEKKFRSVTRVFYLISAIAIPDYKKAFVRAAKTEAARRLAITAIALRRYELKHGKPAPDLPSLVPEFLSDVPRDCMDSQLLKYRANPDGSAVLYSIGEDGKDDGGNSASRKPRVASGLRDGHDMVWPLPAWRSERGSLQSPAQ